MTLSFYSRPPLERRCAMWLRSLFALGRSACSPTRRSDRAQRRPRLTVEWLEERALPSNYSAASVSDLIADINAANQAGDSSSGVAMNHYFDEIARTLASGFSRRQALWRMGGILAGAGLGVVGLSGRALSDTADKCHDFCKPCVDVSDGAYARCRRVCLPCPSTTQMCGSCSSGFTCCQGGYPCIGGTCGSCSDGIKDGQETDRDCGGPVGVPCAAGKKCILPRDCQSGTCTNGVCQP